MEGNSIFTPSLREVKNWLTRLVSEGQKMKLLYTFRWPVFYLYETSLCKARNTVSGTRTRLKRIIKSL